MSIAGDLDAAVTTAIEKRQRKEWFAGAARAHYGRCETCERHRNADGRPLLVARQPRRRKFQCFRCFLGLPLEALPPEPCSPMG